MNGYRCRYRSVVIQTYDTSSFCFLPSPQNMSKCVCVSGYRHAQDSSSQMCRRLQIDMPLMSLDICVDECMSVCANGYECVTNSIYTTLKTQCKSRNGQMHECMCKWISIHTYEYVTNSIYTTLKTQGKSRNGRIHEYKCIYIYIYINVYIYRYIYRSRYLYLSLAKNTSRRA